MKTVVVQAYCDLCSDAGQEEVPAFTERTFNGYLLDLCERHQTQVEELLIVLNGMFRQGVEVEPHRRRGTGRKVGRPSIEQKESVEWRTCPDCGHIPPTRSALGTHVKSKHNKMLRDYEWST